MQSRFSRTELLIGTDAVKKLRHAHVAVFGAGGVGGYAIEALVRAGVGVLDIIDPDKVNITNINRQIFAKNDTVGLYKVDVAAGRCREINPDIFVNVHRVFFGPETADSFDFTKYDYVIDAIDTVTGKIALIMKAKEAGTPIISAMGAGNKLDPTRFEVADISKTSVCPLAKVMRKELKKRGIEHLKVVYSKEPPIENYATEEGVKKPIPGSISFVPSVAGLIMAGEVIKDLIL
jgi:tRNA A37 threonylcarbamoyladenosine dehydratase